MSTETKERIRAIINSRNRLNISDSSDNFTYSFNETVTRVKGIEIERIVIPYSFYPINSTNNVLTFNNGVNSITITPGSYTATTLINEMNTKLAVTFAGQSPSVSYSSTNLKLTISKTSAFKVDSYIDVPTSTASYILGFHVTSATSTSVTGDSALDISGPKNILISSNYLTNGIQHKTLFADTTYQNVLWAIPVSGSPGDIIETAPSEPFNLNSKMNIPAGDVIDISLYDDKKNQLSLNGLDWTLQLIFLID